MYNIAVNEIPKQRWFSEKAEELVNNFNAYAKEHKDGRLVLSMYSEHESVEDLDYALEEGMYDFIYPQNNPYSGELKQMVEEAEKVARFLGFNTSCVNL